MVTERSDAKTAESSLAKKAKKENTGNCRAVSFTLGPESDEASHSGNQDG